MHFSTAPSPVSRLRPALLSGAAVALALLLSNCGGGGGGGGGRDDFDVCEGAPVAECDAGDPCPSEDGFARVCEDTRDQCGGQCTNVCDYQRDFDPDSVPLGRQCEFDVDCEGLAKCDNDEGEGRATCLCVDADADTCTPSYENVAYRSKEFPDACRAAMVAMENGGTPGRYNLKMTCRWTDGTCTEDEDVIGIGRDYNDETDLCYVNNMGRKWEGGAGSFCKKDFSFRQIPMVAHYETGIFRFTTQETFDAWWIIYSERGGHVLARCIGKGRAKTAGEADDPTSCLGYFPFD